MTESRVAPFIHRRRTAFVAVVTATCVLALQLVLAPPASAGLSYVGAVHSHGSFTLHSPLGVTTDGSGNIYVADTSAHRIVKFNSDGDPIRVFGHGSDATQHTNGHLYYPAQVAWSKTTNQIYVADSAGQDVQVFTPAGAFVRKWGQQGSADGDVSLPSGIAIDCAGNVYVANAQPPNDVEVFTSTGTFIRRFGDANIDVATGVAVTSYTNGSCNAPDVIVADEYYGRLVQFDGAGNYIRDIGTPGHLHLQFDHPDQLAVRTDGSGTHIWAAESGNFRVQEVTTHNAGSTWAYTTQIKKGREPLSSNHGVAVDNKGRILAANTGTSEVYIYKNRAPALTLAHAHNSRQHIRDTQGLFFQLTYNQLSVTCHVDVKAKITVPPHAAHEFAIDNDVKVGNDLVDVKLPLSDRQLHWLNKAWGDGHDVAIATKATGCTNNDVHVTKSVDFSL
jgi:DNA-binding beta-propeller fold protein YncE